MSGRVLQGNAKTQTEQNYKFDTLLFVISDKVCMLEQIMTNDDNLESNLLSSSLLKCVVCTS